MTTPITAQDLVNRLSVALDDYLGALREPFLTHARFFFGEACSIAKVLLAEQGSPQPAEPVVRTEQQVIDESQRRYLFDVEHHALVHIATSLVVSAGIIDPSSYDRDRASAVARQAASIALVLADEPIFTLHATPQPIPDPHITNPRQGWF